jgi:histidine ammonia-lyase
LNRLADSIRGVRKRAGFRPVAVDGRTLTLEEVEQVADGARCALTPAARRAVTASRRAVERAIASGRTVYGVNTGFGHLASVGIPADQLDALQVNLIRSHAAGTGAPFGERIVRAILALRTNCLARGHSGLKTETLERMLAMLHAGIVPYVPEQGSVGASGDLAPLAHVALALIGEGDVFFRGKRVPAKAAWKAARLKPVTLAAKEGIALINGTQVMTAIGTLALLRAERLAVAADVVGAMTLEALKGSHRAFDKRIHDARPLPGQRVSAANLRKILADSPIERGHADCGRVQDAYALRCIPQVHGAARDTLGFVRATLAIEINSSTDNPMVFAESGDLVSGGNFHGQPVAVAMDHMAVGVCSLAGISERRIERLLNPALSDLPPFLAEDAGLNSGFMMAHVTAAALVAENKVLAHPASVDTIPTSAGKEDHVSMGVHAARKAAQIVENTITVLAVELLAAAQALDFLAPQRPGRGAHAAHRFLRRKIAGMKRDRFLAPDIEAAREIVLDPAMRIAVERAAGTLG